MKVVFIKNYKKKKAPFRTIPKGREAVLNNDFANELIKEGIVESVDKTKIVEKPKTKKKVEPKDDE